MEPYEILNPAHVPEGIDLEKSDFYQKAIELANMIAGARAAIDALHAARIKKYTAALCRAYNARMPEEALDDLEIEAISEAAMLHDIGKVSIADDILFKRGKLSLAEYESIKQHTITGSMIAKKVTEFYRLEDDNEYTYYICRYHHERYDGKGYPEGLAGEEIPLCAQLVSIIDVYDALTTDKSYKKALPHDVACAMILRGECGKFSPALIETFKSVSDELFAIHEGNLNRKEMLQRTYVGSKRHYWVTKRIMDVTFSALAVICLSPLLVLIAAAIWIDDPHGSPIFKQVRLGRHKKPFVMYKFRTMVVDAEKLLDDLKAENQKDGPAFKMVNDPRVTRVGRFLRKTSLDELPQLFNILKGNMTIVGPRPPLPTETKEYDGYQEVRLSVTPGLTCDWQVQPNRDGVKFEKWMDMDVDYIGARSIKNDFRIIFKTVWSVIHKQGN